MKAFCYDAPILILKKGDIMNVVLKEDTKKTFSGAMRTCSFICSVLVVFIHSYNISSYNISTNSVVFWFEEIISQFIARGAVPFFFISSAFFLYQREKDVLTVYRSRYKSLVLPYLLWNTIYMIFFGVLTKLSLSDAGMDRITVTNILKGIFLFDYNYTYWFMFHLILFTLLYPIIKQIICRNKIVCALFFLTLLGGYFFSVINGDMKDNDIIESLVYYYLGAIIGYYYKDKTEKIVAVQTKQKILILSILTIMGGVAFVASNIYDVNVTLIRNLIMVLFLFFVSSLQKVKIHSFLLGLSFMIYSMHPIILETIEKIVFIVCPHTAFFATVDYIIAPIVSVVIILCVCALLKKVLPAIYRLLNGNRM